MLHRRLEDGINAMGQLASRGMASELLLAGPIAPTRSIFSSLKVLARNLGVPESNHLCGQSGGGEIQDFLFAVRPHSCSRTTSNEYGRE